MAIRKQLNYCFEYLLLHNVVYWYRKSVKEDCMVWAAEVQKLDSEIVQEKKNEKKMTVYIIFPQ